MRFFSERQRFRQWWVVLIVSIPGVVVTWRFVQQVVFGEPWGDNPISGWALVLVWIGVGLFLPLLFLLLRLVTEVDESGVHVRFQPVGIGADYEFEQIAAHAPIDYRPIKDFGGWGIRWAGRGRRAWSVSGTRGVQLDLFDGRQIVIGSQRPHELDLAISSALRQRR